MAGHGVCEERRGCTIGRCFLARHELFFFYPPVIYFSFASHGIPREIVLVPPLNRMNVTAVNKDLCCLVLTVFGGV